MAWNLDQALPYLAQKDPRMAAAIQEIGGLCRQPTEGLFTGLVQSIIGQQISLKAADTVWQRLCSRIGSAVTPQGLLQTSVDDLRACGMSARKASYLHSAASAFDAGGISEADLSTAPDEAVIATLTTLPGVGRWTAEMLLIFSLGRLRIA